MKRRDLSSVKPLINLTDTSGICAKKGFSKNLQCYQNTMQLLEVGNCQNFSVATSNQTNSARHRMCYQARKS